MLVICVVTPTTASSYAEGAAASCAEGLGGRRLPEGAAVLQDCTSMLPRAGAAANSRNTTGKCQPLAMLGREPAF